MSTKKTETSEQSEKSEKKEGLDTLRVPENLQVYEDSRSKAKSVALPFQFPDGIPGIIIVSRLHRMGWRPADVIKEIKIVYK